MRIKKLELKNFRGFEELTIDFPEGESGLAVFVGVNGAGKSSVLEGIVSLLYTYYYELFKTEQVINGDYKNIEYWSIGDRLTDFHYTVYNIERSLLMEAGGQEVSINNEATNYGGSISISKSTNPWINKFVKEDNLIHLRKSLLNNPPVIAYYSAKRATPIDPSLKARDISSFQPIDVYSGAFAPSINFNEFFEWFRSAEDFENEQIRFTENAKFRSNELEAVRQAISKLLIGFTKLRVQRQPHEDFIVEKEGENLSILSLSDGEKTLLALTGDIARRLTIANPNLENPIFGKGVVLIDEIEQHLHPGWQRTIIPNLRRTFPNIQFIVTTHSPQVLSNVPRENVFILEDFKLVENTPHTYGRDSNSILWDLFAVRERPEEAQEDFSKLSRLMNDPENDKKAKKLLDELAEKYGDDDDEVVRARLHFEFLTEG